MFSSSRTRIQFEDEDSDQKFAAYYGLDLNTSTSPTIPLTQSSHQLVADTTRPQIYNQPLGAARFAKASFQGTATQQQSSLALTVGNIQAQPSHQLPNATTTARRTFGMSQDLIIMLLRKRTKPPENELRIRLQACTPQGRISGLSSDSAPFMKPVAGARTTISDLPYDVIYTICNHIVELYPACPLNCSKGLILNKITGQHEERLELNSTAIPKIIAFLNAGAAWADMENFMLACPEHESNVKESMKSMRTITQRRRPLCIYQIWFEDLSWVMASLNPFGCANIATVSLYWDNRERATILRLAPPHHRSENAPANLFNNLRSKCQSLNTLHVMLALENLRARKPDGQQRSPHTKDYKGVRGMDELKALVQAVCLREGGGEVTIGLDSSDGRDYGQSLNARDHRAEEKEALVCWLKDGEPVELQAIEDAVVPSGSAICCRTCEGDYCGCYAGI